MRRPSPTFKLSAIATGILFSGMAVANAEISADLAKTLSTAPATSQLSVVVSYNHSGPINATELAAMKSLGITKGITMRALPIAGVLATPAEIRALATQPDVVSIFPNKPLRYFDHDAYLSQSAQLYLEAMIFSLGPVWSLMPSFRAEKSRTVRHLAEFSHLEAEAPWVSLEDILKAEEKDADFRKFF